MENLPIDVKRIIIKKYKMISLLKKDEILSYLNKL